MKNYILILLLVLFAASCNTQDDPFIEDQLEYKPLVLRAGLEKRVAQDNEFALDLFKRTLAESKAANLFISPLSVSIALGMTWNGANGPTKSQMETALKMSGMSVADINDYYKAMQSGLPAIDPATKLKIANSLWYREGYPVKQEFLKTNADYFSAYIKELDFSKSWAVDTINNWCARKTENLITKPLDEIPGSAVMYLVNAIYFKGIWTKRFDAKNTRESDFNNESGNVQKVNMMSVKDTFAYTQDENAQYLELPYGNKSFGMTIILPKTGKTTGDVLNNLTPGKLKTNFDSMVATEAEIYLPRFRSKSKLLLNKPLHDMGMKLAFDGPADFSNISNDDLLVSRVIHDTFVDVTEEGTEAAAVTIVEIIKTSMPDIPRVMVNKPFLYIIREKSTGVILFIGKMGNMEKY